VNNTIRVAAAAITMAMMSAGFGERGTVGAADRTRHEVWLVDQSNSSGKAYGGAIHIFNVEDLTADEPSSAQPSSVIDLGDAVAALCLASTGANPVRPHMLVFNATESHAALSFVVSGHVVFFDARTRAPLACLRTEVGAGGARQAHAVWPTGDDRYLLVANQNGKKFERIRTDYATNTFVQEPGATLALYGSCVTPSGAPCESPGIRPDNAPICPFTASDNGPAFTSLRGGGMLVVDWRTSPMSIVGEYDITQVPANGCGFIEARGMVYGNGGGATPSNLDQFTVFRLPMTGYGTGAVNAPPAELLFNDDAPHRDAHGVGVTKHQRYVWVGDRDANVVEVFDARDGSHAGRFDLASAPLPYPTVDLFAPTPDGKWMFMSTRGPNPLSGDPHSSQGTSPGLLVVRIDKDGREGSVHGHVAISNLDASGIERADGHGIRLRAR
jgi:hypothetical protein